MMTKTRLGVGFEVGFGAWGKRGLGGILIFFFFF